MEKIAQKEPLIQRALTVEDAFTKNEEERRFYELREKGRRDYINAIENSERRGKIEGKMEGKIEGKMEDARLMLADDMSPKLISKYTGLSVGEIEALR